MCFLLISCTSTTGRFSVISTNNVRGLEHLGKNRNDQSDSIVGKSCEHRIYLTRTLAGAVLLFPWFMPSFDIVFGDKERKVENATQNALEKGRSRGVFDGDLITNATIKEKNIIVPLIYGYKCDMVQGNVVSSITRSKDYLIKQ